MTLEPEFDGKIRISISVEPRGIARPQSPRTPGTGLEAGRIEGGLGPDIKIPFASPKNSDRGLSVVLP